MSDAVISASGRTPVRMEVNGVAETVYVEPRWLLSDVLRHQLGLTGTHVGCEQGVCGVCTVLLDGVLVRSCLLFAVQVDGHRVTTIEGVTPDEGLSPIQASFQRHHGLQCGFCTPAMVLTAEALLRTHPNPSEADIRDAFSGNICRCTGYQFIVDAIRGCSEEER
ncbi:2Fe-2S iron-sulfur cluster-binding protein [Alicyclobacillus sp. SP_1]|jgi:aerobic-type carbon monoxide dehydrogenase small subunit (CoxS/CutS family)|uniref:(2Fe-2S)-binding protein n=1 Tax=Alicyclobacillus sp. SP_1 TaxID=2942475 RepID=UPI0028053A17|nr:2Fe-2S iron-sulfur cluster-binding protein [Alicyclobacillus sp. SP_1]